MKYGAPRLSIVLPCYNEALNLGPLLERYRSVWQDIPAELILVDNGSTDETPDVLEGAIGSGAYPFLRVLTVPRNQGYGFGLMTGLRDARGEFLAFSHADMQCAPEDLFAAWRVLMWQPRPAEVVVKGRRYGRAWQDSLITIRMSVLASSILLRRLADINAQPKLFHRSLLQELAQPPNGLQFDLYVLYRAVRSSRRINTVPVAFSKRLHGQSSWAFSFAARRRAIWETIAYMFRLGFRYNS